MSTNSNNIPDYFAHFYSEDSRGNFVDFKIGEAYTQRNGCIYITHELGSLILIPSDLKGSLVRMPLLASHTTSNTHDQQILNTLQSIKRGT